MSSELGTGILIVILLIVVISAGKSSLKHLKGEGGCCGGGSEAPKVRRRKLNQIVSVKKIQIEGMKCENCRRNVENTLNSLNQVNARVRLKEKEALVKLGTDISDGELRKR